MNEFQIKTEEKSRQNPKELIFRYIHYLPWLIVSVILALGIAFVQLRYTTPTFGVSGKLLVKKSKQYAGEKFDDIFMSSSTSSNNLSDEIELIKSRTMAARIVHVLDLQKRYFNKGKIRTTIMHSSDLPFSLHISSISDSSKAIVFKITISNDRFTINESQEHYYFGETVKLPSCTFTLEKSRVNKLSSFASNEFDIVWVPLEEAADVLSNSLIVEQVNTMANVLNFSYETQNTKLGRDIIDAYMREYINASLEDKKQTAINTLSFIEEQLDTVRIELGGVERNLLDYKQKYNVFDPEQQSKLFFSKSEGADKAIMEQGVKLKVVDYLLNYLGKKSNAYKMVPSNLGIDEPSLAQQIMEYNKLQQERELGLQTTTEANPMIIMFETALERLRTDMLENLINVRNAYRLSQNELTQTYTSANNQISDIPLKQKQLQDVTRQQKILQELYSYLLQKKLETAISSASTISNIKILDDAKATGEPISPNRRTTYMLALFFGLVIPIGAVALKEYLNDKVRSKGDIQRLTEAPILGEIGHADNAGALLVKQNNRGFISEQFRIIRSNMQYVLPKVDNPVILVTSSFSGEGKSFVSTNLGAVLALSGKKTVILEMDIRKPKIMKGLGMEERKGITNYIVGNISIDDIIIKVPEVDNLYVIPCGPVPPNPSEMLLDSNVRALFSQLQGRFDTIVIDSAPVGLVSDAISLAAYANATVYIVRHNYTLKKQIELIDSIYKQKKLPHLSIVINDIEARGGYGSYYGYGSYGYGYGYGLGSLSKKDGGYFEGEDKRKSRFKLFKKSK